MPGWKCGWAGWVLFVIGFSLPQAASTQGVTIEYVAHAAVILEVDGTRILIDPYDGSRWMGYSFPSDLDVDAVLVTHPHYDHNAVFNVSASAPVFTEPGRYAIGSIELLGVESEHVGGAGFRARGQEPYNVIWTVIGGGLRLTHVGDNRPLTEEDLDGIGTTDVLFVPPFHSVEDAGREGERLGAGMVIPIHYGLPGLRAEGFTMGDADAWLGEAPTVHHEDRRVLVTPGNLPERVEFHVLQPHPGVVRWRVDLQEAWSLFRRAREVQSEGDRAAAVALLVDAIRLGGEVMTFPLALGDLLTDLGRGEEAQEVWELALAHASSGDIEPTLRIQGALAKRYAEDGRLVEAEVLYQAVLRAGRSWAIEVVADARGFLGRQ